MRRRLPDTRESVTHKFNVAGHEGYLIVGLYEDGSPGELFITMAKEGSTIGGLMDSLGTAISVALQYGVPVESLVNKFAHQRFEPMGMTANSDIPFAKSLVDYIFRWLGMQFIDGYRERNAPVRAARAAAETAPTDSRTTQEDRAWNQSRTDRTLASPAAPGASKNPSPSSSTRTAPASETAAAPSHARVIVSEQFAEIVETIEGDRKQKTTIVGALGLLARPVQCESDGRRTRVRRLRLDHRPQRQLLPLPQLRTVDGLQLTRANAFVATRPGRRFPPAIRPAARDRGAHESRVPSLAVNRSRLRARAGREREGSRERTDAPPPPTASVPIGDGAAPLQASARRVQKDLLAWSGEHGVRRVRPPGPGRGSPAPERPIASGESPPPPQPGGGGLLKSQNRRGPRGRLPNWRRPRSPIGESEPPRRGWSGCGVCVRLSPCDRNPLSPRCFFSRSLRRLPRAASSRSATRRSRSRRRKPLARRPSRPRSPTPRDAPSSTMWSSFASPIPRRRTP